MNLLLVQFCYSKVWLTTLQNSPITPLCNEVGGNATRRGSGPTCPLLPGPPPSCFLMTKCAEFSLARSDSQFYIKTEVDVVTIKEELDIEPLVLQPQIMPCPSPLTQAGSSSRLSSSSMDIASPKSLCTCETDVSWVKDIERRRIECKQKLAKAMLIIAEAACIQASAALIQTEALRMHAETMTEFSNKIN
ncbi:hypothetical protein EVAR_39804_1 [Eumeta japonica]|uniref:Uncharacterized protein n=1 Tax=Eumeta variegata TaxID=151549 RepID=A0A4C1XBB4_EUMVA|nr:hypothetical protein EVAR_39804_1 [Eumeta japonica]